MSQRISEVMISNRRDFLVHMGRVGAAVTPAMLGVRALACDENASKDTKKIVKEASLRRILPEGVLEQKPVTGIKPTTKDELTVAEGINARVVVTEGMSLNNQGAFLGSNPDYLAMIPLDKNDPHDALLWVNNETPSMTYLYGPNYIAKRTPEKLPLERKWVGGSIIRVKKLKDKGWTAFKDDRWNRRFDATTKIPFSGDTEIAGSSVAEGTLANCAGGVTPWNTILTCEENYQDYYGYAPRDKHFREGLSRHGWESFKKNPPQHYGWVVEINPFTGKAKKLVSLGRFSHESATVAQTKDGRAVVYSGDDRTNECLYKFVADKPGSLDNGTLYVANVEQGRWIPLDRTQVKVLKNEFKTQEDVMTYARVASELVGGSPLDRPEDIAIDPKTNAVIVALSNNKKAGRPFGSLLRLEEKKDFDSMEFEAKTLVSGGKGAGFVCPDNLEFDDNGNLWVASDISSGSVGKGIYAEFGNNGLYVVPMKGNEAGRSIQLVAAPKQAELTGVTIAPDKKTIFLSVQHPGDYSYLGDSYTSQWPYGFPRKPHSAVVALSGPTIERFLIES